LGEDGDYLTVPSHDFRSEVPSGHLILVVEKEIIVSYLVPSKFISGLIFFDVDSIRTWIVVCFLLVILIVVVMLHGIGATYLWICLMPQGYFMDFYLCFV